MAPPNKRKAWDKDNMNRAVEAVVSKEMGYLKAARYFCVPQTTLERYVKQRRESGSEEVTTKLGRKPVFPPDLESDLVRHCLLMEERFFGVTRADLRRLAYRLAVANNIRNKFNDKSESAGKKWLQGFLKRHASTLSVRIPQGIAMSRVKSFSEENVNNFFNVLEPELQKINFNPNRIYNCDETGISIVQHRNTKVIALKGKRSVASLTSAERGCLITVVVCMNAAGHYVPPLIVFPRKNMQAELMDGTPPGSIHACHISGWIQSDIFTQWFRHFISVTKPTKSDPVILVLDGHYSHTRNMDVIDLGREHGVSIICLPPHSSHRMQPLDVAFMKPFKTLYCQEIESWLKINFPRTVTIRQVGKLFGNAYLRTATVEIAVNGFRKSGIYPFNRNVFTRHDFPIHENEAQTESHESSSADDVRQPNGINMNDKPAAGCSGQNPSTSGCSGQNPSTSGCSGQNPSTSNSQMNSLRGFVCAADLSPLPSVSVSSERSSRAGSAKVITSSPHKQQLASSQMKKVGIVNQKVAAQCKGLQKVTKKMGSTFISKQTRKRERKCKVTSSSSED